MTRTVEEVLSARSADHPGIRTPGINSTYPYLAQTAAAFVSNGLSEATSSVFKEWYYWNGAAYEGFKNGVTAPLVVARSFH